MDVIIGIAVFAVVMLVVMLFRWRGHARMEESATTRPGASTDQPEAGPPDAAGHRGSHTRPGDTLEPRGDTDRQAHPTGSDRRR